MNISFSKFSGSCYEWYILQVEEAWPYFQRATPTGLGAMNKNFPTATPLWLKTTEAMGCNGTQAEKLTCMRCEKDIFIFN